MPKISDSDADILRQIRRWQQNFRVTGNVKYDNRPDGASVHVFPGAGPSTPADEIHLPIKVKVQNDSGSDRAALEILGINSVLTSTTTDLATFKADPLISGVTPTTASHTNKFVVLESAIVRGGQGFGYANGVVAAKVNMSNAAHGFADVKDGDATQLQSNSKTGSHIIWKESGTGTKWALLRIGVGTGLPTDTGRGKVLTLIDILTPASSSWDYPRW